MRWVLAKCFAQSPTQAHFFSLMETKHLEEQAGTSRVLGLHQESQGGMTMSQLPVDRVVGLDQESKGDTKRSQQPLGRVLGSGQDSKGDSTLSQHALGQAQAVNVRAGCRENKGDSKRPRCREDDDPPLDSAFKARMFEIDTEEIRVRQAYKDTFKGKDLPFDLHVIPDLNRFLGSTWINVFGSPGTGKTTLIEHLTRMYSGALGFYEYSLEEQGGRAGALHGKRVCTISHADVFLGLGSGKINLDQVWAYLRIKHPYLRFRTFNGDNKSAFLKTCRELPPYSALVVWDEHEELCVLAVPVPSVGQPKVYPLIERAEDGSDRDGCRVLRFCDKTCTFEDLYH
jgi:hypothetical protein